MRAIDAGSFLRRVLQRVLPGAGHGQDRARSHFRSAVQAVRNANQRYDELEIARDVEEAVREVREARSAASRR
jgi:hypothetical protein